jgi:hypothetical protein
MGNQKQKKKARHTPMLPAVAISADGEIREVDHRDVVMVTKADWEQFKAEREQMLFKIQNAQAILAAQRDFMGAVHSIDKLTTNIVFAAITSGKGETLRKELRTLNAHDTLAGRLMDFGDVVTNIRSAGIDLLLDDDTIRGFTLEAKDFAERCQLVEMGKSDGVELIEFIEEKATGIIQDVVTTLRQDVNAGGRPQRISRARIAKRAAELRAYQVQANQKRRDWAPVLTELISELRTEGTNESRDDLDYLLYLLGPNGERLQKARARLQKDFSNIMTEYERGALS